MPWLSRPFEIASKATVIPNVAKIVFAQRGRRERARATIEPTRRRDISALVCVAVVRNRWCCIALSSRSSGFEDGCIVSSMSPSGCSKLISRSCSTLLGQRGRETYERAVMVRLPHRKPPLTACRGKLGRCRDLYLCETWPTRTRAGRSSRSPTLYPG
jgi:hypothetical protein